MSISNLARTIGVTIVGYSSADPSPEEIMKAVRHDTSNYYVLLLNEYFPLSVPIPNSYSGEIVTNRFRLLEHLHFG